MGWRGMAMGGEGRNTAKNITNDSLWGMDLCAQLSLVT